MTQVDVLDFKPATELLINGFVHNESIRAANGKSRTAVLITTECDFNRIRFDFNVINPGFGMRQTNINQLLWQCVTRLIGSTQKETINGRLEFRKDGSPALTNGAKALRCG